MKAAYSFGFLFLLIALVLSGCKDPSSSSKGTNKTAEMHGSSATQQDIEQRIQTNLAKLSAEDRQLALAQKYCAVESESRLGSMGPPMKLLIKNQPVFLCCKSCKKAAVQEPDVTLAKVKTLQAKYGNSH